MFSKSTLLAVLGLATLARSHMEMSSPVPFGKSTLNNSPLIEGGTDFPCKQRTGVYDAEGASNTMPLGSTQTVSFIGSAVHGGGSCQFSVSYDANPTKSSVFKVIHSIEGGCPMKNIPGNNGDSASQADPDTYSFTVPTSLPTGTATFAWTWFNKIGNREMYMNCAPITITAGSSKRSAEDEELMARNITQLMERDQAAFSALPDMFVANIPTSSCESVDSADVKFPNPGDSLEQFGLATATPVAPTGPSCGAVVAAAAATGASSAAGASSAPAVTQASSAPASSGTGLPGGVFATIASSSSGSQATSAPAASVAASSSIASQAAPSAASTPVASASTPASTGTTGSGSAIAAGTACTTEGMWNCVGGTSFQQCASGTWSVVQQLAAGTSCTAGQTMNINIVASAAKKRSVRFSHEHIRRHLQSS